MLPGVGISWLARGCASLHLVGHGTWSMSRTTHASLGLSPARPLYFPHCPAHLTYHHHNPHNTSLRLLFHPATPTSHVSPRPTHLTPCLHVCASHCRLLLHSAPTLLPMPPPSLFYSPPLVYWPQDPLNLSGRTVEQFDHVQRGLVLDEEEVGHMCLCGVFPGMLCGCVST